MMKDDAKVERRLCTYDIGHECDSLIGGDRQDERGRHPRPAGRRHKTVVVISVDAPLVAMSGIDRLPWVFVARAFGLSDHALIIPLGQRDLCEQKFSLVSTAPWKSSGHAFR